MQKTKTISISLPDYTPHPGQMEVHSHPALWKVIWAGRRWGKSRLALMHALWVYAQLIRVERPPSLVPKVHMWAVAPNYNQLQQAWEEAMAFIPNPLIEMALVDEWTIRLVGGCIFQFRSADNPASLQTVGLDYLWITEAQDVSDHAWARLVPTLSSPGRARLLIAEGIPPARKNWFYRLFQEGLPPNNPRHLRSFRFKSTDNPLIDPAWVQEQAKVLPEEDFARMYMAEYVEAGGAAMPDPDAVPHTTKQDGPQPGREYVMGLDLGRRQDYTCAVVMDRAARRMVDYIRMGKTDWSLQRREIIGLARKWNVSIIVMDASGAGDPLYEEFYAQGLPVQPYNFSGTGRYNLLHALSVSFARRDCTIIPDPVLLREIRSLRKQVTPSGNITIAPENRNEHDDFVVALALALSGCHPPKDILITVPMTSRSYLRKGGEASIMGPSLLMSAIRRQRQNAIRQALH